MASEPARAGAELVRLGALFALCALAVVLFKRHDLAPWIGDCSAGGYADGRYLAYCNDVRYGDYEHYAFLHGTVPGQIDAVKAADVLFLGNSRAQFGFSTDAVHARMGELGVPHYVFGFGLGGTSDVPLSVMRRHGIDARALVVNADPFFSHVVNPTFTRVLAGGPLVDWEHRLKALLQRAQQRVCADDGWAWLEGALCAGDEVTLFRSARNGRWDGRWFERVERYPVSREELSPLDREGRLVRAAAIADEFIAESGAERDCIVLTVVPHEAMREVFARELARRLGVRWSSPRVEGLETFDRSHLSRDSAERWSSALLDDISPLIEDCTT